MKTPLTLPLVAPKDDADTLAHLGEKHQGQAVQLQARWVPPASGGGAGSLAVSAIPARQDNKRE